MKNTGEGGGEIVQVQGGHILRSTGRKDRHSKVYTSKGPRDRRVRLSAHTAIQFYDVQDRLGYDRPSKAVDWLIKKAKSAIDKLAELPPWHPNSNANNEPEFNNVGTSEMGIQEQLGDNNNNSNTNDGSSSFLTHHHHLENDAISDTMMRSFFPTSTNNSSINFQNYPPDITNPTEDLGLSLQPSNDNQTLFPGQVGFDPNFQRIHGGFLFNSPQTLGFSQRGTLQSSFTQSVRGWEDLHIGSTVTDHQNRPHDFQQSSIFGSRFESGGLHGYNVIPARIHGDEQQSDHRPSSSSPHSHH